MQQEKLDLLDINIEQIKQIYFADAARRMQIGKGDVLLKQGEFNNRLYLVLSGTLVGYFQHEEAEEPMEIFRSTKDMFVGVYSFFSHSELSFATMVAEEPCELAYLESGQEIFLNPNQGNFAQHFLPIIVNELSTRQLWARRVALEKENTLKKLAQTEKMAMLGEMAAGLAHELNNAVGVLQRKTEWLSEEIAHYLHEKDQRGMFHFFEVGRDRGQFISSTEAREKRKKLAENYKIPNSKARKLARIGLPDEQLAKYAQLPEADLDRMNYYWEIGASFHDMLLASNHAVHVVKSVKQLGVADSGRMPGISVNDTLKEAMALLKSQLRKVKLHTQLEDLPPVAANSGELVQIWLNIMKNACEAMFQAHTTLPELQIFSAVDGTWISVTITDNGPGIPEELKEKIFQPSFSTKKDGLSFGLGLGLAIVQRLVESYHGHISLESKPAKTTFKILLPYGKVEPNLH